MTDGEIAKIIFGTNDEKTRKLLLDFRQYGVAKPYRSYHKLGSSGWSIIKDSRCTDSNMANEWVVSDRHLHHLFDEDDIAFMRMIAD